jgi:glutathione S-transferase
VPQPEYTLHIANKNYSSWSLRPWLLLTELGIPFAERLHLFQPGANHDAFRAFSPTGQVPCLVDGAVAVWESLAITEYLAERHAAVWPRDAAARAWARSVAAEMHAGFGALRAGCSHNCGLRIRLHAHMPALAPALWKDIARIAELWADGLGRFGGPFLAGSVFTAADAFFAPVAFRFQTYGIEIGGEPAAYAERLRALPGMRAWYDAAIAETAREPGHEAEARAAGTLIADLRAAPAI